jgi:hypothetical protein
MAVHPGSAHRGAGPMAIVAASATLLGTASSAKLVNRRKKGTMDPKSSLPLASAKLRCWLAIVSLLGACSDAERATFGRDIKPLFDARCVACHHSEQGYTDLENPFNTEDGYVSGSNHGAVGGGSVWFVNHDYGPPLNIAPYEPDESYLVEKVTNPALRPDACTPERCLPDEGGFFMPPAPRPLRQEQIDLVREWIREGADPAVFRDRITPTSFRQDGVPNGYSLLNLFGNYSNLSTPPNDPCRFTGSDPGCNQCSSCHREDGPYYPQGVTAEDFIDVQATFRSDLKLVVPGNPEESFLMMKLQASEPSSEVGAPMPHGYEPFSESEVAQLRQWIADGAQNN